MTNSTGPNKDDKYWRLNKKWLQTTTRELKGLLRIMMPDKTETSKWNSLVGVSVRDASADGNDKATILLS